MYSDEAFLLVFLTGLQESKYDYIKQWKGCALGWFQIEPDTHTDLFSNYLFSRHDLLTKVLLLTKYSSEISNTFNKKQYCKDFINDKKYLNLEAELITNLEYQVAVCRLVYYRKPFKLSAIKGVESAANIWKQYYNTNLGKGETSEFIEKANLFYKK